jgi:hypothetical protein
VVEQVFRDNAEHPPLGRWLLGIASVGRTVRGTRKGPDPTGQYVLAGRPPAGVCRAGRPGRPGGGRRWGPPRAAAALALMAVPVFAHAHLARSIPSSACSDAGPDNQNGRSQGVPIAMAAPGGGARTLTKIHAWLLPISEPKHWPGAAARWRHDDLSAVGSACSVAALALVRSLDEAPGIMGRWAHRQSWSRISAASLPIAMSPALPWFYFAAVPAGLYAPAPWRAAGRTAASTVPFALLNDRISVPSARGFHYDGERLFLHVFRPGRLGSGWVWVALEPPLRSSSRIALAAFLVIRIYGGSLHPFGLSYYNGLVGGLPGAERLALEPPTGTTPSIRCSSTSWPARPAPRIPPRWSPRCIQGRGS